MVDIFQKLCCEPDCAVTFHHWEEHSTIWAVIFMVPRTHSTHTYINPEQLGMAHFLSKKLWNFQQNFEHREFWILEDLVSTSKTGAPRFWFLPTTYIVQGKVMCSDVSVGRLSTGGEVILSGGGGIGAWATWWRGWGRGPWSVIPRNVNGMLWCCIGRSTFHYFKDKLWKNNNVQFWRLNHLNTCWSTRGISEIVTTSAVSRKTSLILYIIFTHVRQHIKK